MRMAVLGKADTDKEHQYQLCNDDDCPRFPCRVYKEGYARGYQDGVITGYAAGYADGFSEGYSQGAADASQ